MAQYAIDQRKMDQKNIQIIVANRVFRYVKFIGGESVSWSSVFAQLTMSFMLVAHGETDECKKQEKMEKYWTENWRFACKKLNEKRSNVNSRVKRAFIRKCKCGRLKPQRGEADY